ncbi:molybdopterin molybdotransferase MoeA [Actinoplanes sp. G11-F43]|uniref:molybdopterin molybdotransferase MoeA n=1 Tax=Actinoplanes sp. G11-F43 TaxID=3424130 RepID=UPI003D34A6E4
MIEVLAVPRASTRTAWSRAYAIARDSARPLPGRVVPVTGAVGLVLAEQVRCARPVPAFDNAAMDGFAVAGDGPWTITGRVLAGTADAGTLAPGHAVEIGTGAVVPVGADAVLPYEDCVVSGDTVTGSVGPRRHIRRAGDSLAVGAPVVPAGRTVTATVAAAVVQAGVDRVAVHQPPAVSLLVTGDEVISDGVPGPGQVRDTFTGLVTAVTGRAGGIMAGRCRLPDDRDRLQRAVDRAGGDVIVVSGSSSAGAADHLHELLSAAGATWLVRGVACRPGHPQALAVLPDGRWVVSLPGNPYAGLVAALTLLEPLLTALSGRTAAILPMLPVTGSPKLMPGGVRIVPVTADGALVAAGPVGLQAAAAADWLAVLADDWTPGAPAPLLRVP